jgi:hypothetical protein
VNKSKNNWQGQKEDKLTNLKSSSVQCCYTPQLWADKIAHNQIKMSDVPVSDADRRKQVSSKPEEVFF